LYSWRISYRELMRRKPSGRSTWQKILASKDPTVFTVFLEDSAGIAGTLIAFLGILAGQLLPQPVLRSRRIHCDRNFAGRRSGASGA